MNRVPPIHAAPEMTQARPAESTPGNPPVEALLKQATLEIRRLREQLQAAENSVAALRKDAIAIIGMACRFPGGADSPEAFWQLLEQGRDAMSPVPPERWDLDRYYDADRTKAGCMYVREGGFLNDVKGFDPQFFGISPREAEAMDPQQRLLLEVSYEALENAGVPTDSLRGSSTGVFVGICFDDYAQRNVRSGDVRRIDAHSALGTNRSIAAGRVAYVFGLQGPTLQLDTTCSSSLVSLHLACNSLRQGEADLALAGGVNLMLSPEATIGFSRLNALSADGRCRTFDASAEGYARGEGCGMLVLKRLDEALADGDPVLAVVRASALNHDGASNGLTAPSGPAQTAVIRAALKAGGLNADDVQYVEAHGTATPLGDPIEVQALAEALGQRQSPLWLGSVKTNIGHLESAAGVAGVIKSVLALQKGCIPAHLHFQTPSPRIPWQRLPIQVPQQTVKWPAASVRRAGISSFGMSGTNAHVIVEQTPASVIPVAASVEDAPAQLLTLSARTAPALQDVLRRYHEFLLHSTASLADIAASAQCNRAHYEYRRALRVTSIEEALAKIHQLLNSQLVEPVRQRPRIAWIVGEGFLQNGLQSLVWLWQQPAFRSAVEQCASVLDAPMKKVLLSAFENVELQLQREPVVTAGLLEFTGLYALTQLLKRWGLQADVLHGKGVGSVVTAVLQGALTLSQAAMQLMMCTGNVAEIVHLSADETHHEIDVCIVMGAAAAQSTQQTMAHVLQNSAENDAGLLSLLAQLYEAGLTPDWRQLQAARRFVPVQLPNYPFQRKPYWQTLPDPVVSQTDATWPGTSLLIAGHQLRVYRTLLSASPVNWNDHQVMMRPLFPAAGYLLLLSELAHQAGVSEMRIEDLELERGVWLSDVDVELQSQWQSVASDAWIVQLYQNDQLCAKARVRVSDKSDLAEANTEPFDCLASFTPDEFYRQYSERGVQYGAGFRLLQRVRVGLAQAEAEAQVLLLTQTTAHASQWIHPALVDAGLQLAGALLVDVPGRWLPKLIERFEWFAGSAKNGELHPLQIKAVWRNHNDVKSGCAEGPVFDLLWCDSLQQIVGQLTGLQLQLLSTPDDARADVQVDTATEVQSVDPGLYQVSWIPAALPPKASLLSPEQVQQQLQAPLSALTQHPDAQAYLQLQPLLEKLALTYARDAFRQMGWADAINDVTSAMELEKSLGVIEEQQPLFRRLLLSLLRQQGLDAPMWQAALPWRELNINRGIAAGHLVAGIAETLPQCEAELALVRRCGESLAAVLQGQADALHLLFPAGDLSLLTRLYESSPGARIMNGLLAGAVRTLIAEWPRERPLRILEIGAGTGGSTAHILPMLAAAQIKVEYHFSDVSSHFLQAAKSRFAEFDFLQFTLLDIEQAPAVAASFDLIVAANVLHATRSIQSTLAHVHALLAPAGQLLLLEATESLHWLDLVFGMMPGWWRFDDYGLRPQHPLLTVSQWQHSLMAEHFSVALPLQTDPVLPQTVLLAQRVEAPRSWLMLAPDHAKTEHPLSSLAEILRDHGKVTLADALPSIPQALNGIMVALPACHEEQCVASQAMQINAQMLALVQSLVQWPHPPRLWLLASDQAVQSRLVNSVVWGWVQTIQLEHPELRCTVIHGQVSTLLVNEILADQNEAHVRLTARQRQVARLMPYTQAPKGLQPDIYGTVDGLNWSSIEVPPPADNEIRIQVLASGLNFRDVLIALGQYPEPGLLGAECCGRVLSAGSSVTRFKPGDRVMAIAPKGFDSQLVVDQRLALLIPDALDWLQAATLPVAFVTAAKALLTLAQLQPGEKVLIHNATGGVGLAAVQIARAAGADIFATASASKQSYLDELRVAHVMDSRTTDFADRIMALTDGQGVDVVLNALPGESQQASLSVLAANGRFVEIGKGDGLTDSAFALLTPTAQFHRLDLAALCRDEPAQVETELQRLHERLVAGVWQPLPYTRFDRADVTDAFRYLQQARQIGKVVLADSAPPETGQLSSGIPRIFPDKTYLITGGFGGLGLLVAHWLAEQGARHLCLLGRHIRVGDDQLDQLHAQGVQLRLAAVDVTDKAAMAHLIADIQQSPAPLTGVIHAAGELDDHLLAQMNSDSLTRVLAPKVVGGWLLHELTRDLALSCFVLFASAAGVIGAPGQVNHAAANSFLDELARFRRGLGVPALSLAWGAWSEVGSALKYQQQQGRVGRLPGVSTLTPYQGIQLLERLWCIDAPDVAILPVDWQQALTEPRLSRQALFAALHRKVSNLPLEKDVLTSGAAVVREALLSVTPVQRRERLQHYLLNAVATTLGMKVAELDGDRGFFELGLDSLTGLELKNRLQGELGLSLPSTLIFDYPNTSVLIPFVIDLFESSLVTAAAGQPSLSVSVSNSIVPPVETVVKSPVVIEHQSVQAQLDARLDELDALLGDGDD